MTYILQTSFRDELPHRREYLFQTFHRYFVEIRRTEDSILLITMHIGIGAYLIFGVTEKTVDAAAKRYAYALLETIDIL